MQMQSTKPTAKAVKDKNIGRRLMIQMDAVGAKPLTSCVNTTPSTTLKQSGRKTTNITMA